jgi:uncharacterized protein (UPF0332 family)
VTAQDQLAHYRLSRARQALAEADLLASANQWNGALNRVYYAAFYAARALLALRRIDSSRHSGVIALFQEHFVRTGAVHLDAARVLPQAFARRQRSDYGDFEDAQRIEVQSLRRDVELFIRACEQVVGRESSQA